MPKDSGHSRKGDMKNDKSVKWSRNLSENILKMEELKSYSMRYLIIININSSNVITTKNNAKPFIVFSE